MSHIPQRTEKDCLNCGTIVQGRYCQACGQENIIPKETFWHMVTHFFYDITHFDSNFFHTVHHLVLKPGFLSREYMAGKRASYIHPIKMYVFSSAIFFLLFFSVFKSSEITSTINDPLTIQERNDYIKRLQEKLKKDTGDSRTRSQLILARDTTHILTKKDVLSGNDEPLINFTDRNHKTWEEYDSVQQTLPPSGRDGWVMRRLVKKQIEINIKYKDKPDEAADKFVSSILHRLPYMLFVSLPLFALLLKLVYIRRRKQFYFADHGVFTIHLYVFTFILMMVVFGLGKMEDLTGWRIWDTLTGFLVLGLFVYLYLAMKRFYRQKWGKTLVKFLIVSILSLVMMLVLLVLFMFFSAVTF